MRDNPMTGKSMTGELSNTQKRPVLDIFRVIAAFLIVAIHISLLTSISVTADFVFTRIVARVGVPFFLMATGYFMKSRMAAGEQGYPARFLRKTGLLYGAAILIYLPLNIYNGYFGSSAATLVKDILFNGTFYHLWYLPAVLLGVCVWLLLRKCFGERAALIISAVLYLVGLGGDSYYGFSAQIPVLNSFYAAVFSIADYTRNGLFLAPVFVALGAGIFDRKKTIVQGKVAFDKAHVMGLILSTALLVVEALWLHFRGVQRHDSMYVFLLPVMYFLFSLLARSDGRGSRKMRDVSMAVYVLHPWSIVLIRAFAKVVRMKALLVDNSLIFYVLVCTLSLALALGVMYLLEKFRAPKPSEKGRAWLEIDLSALRHNAAELQKLLPGGCRLMAVVKANAYGHGAVRVAGALEKAGFGTFAVATLIEGIELRRSGIGGEILVLGWTDPADAACLRRWRLSQTVVDSGYARVLSETGLRLSVHIKIDTGMHRLGEDDANISNIESIFSYSNLTVKGMFTHLRESDSLSEESTDFTQRQISRFIGAANSLKAKGYNVGALHFQESYGILNYAGLPCDFARPGIALYGVLCRNDVTRAAADLRPALSLRARIAEVKSIGAGEGVGYGRNFTAAYPMKIAAVAIGYADGIPRNAAEKGLTVLVRGQIAPVVGLVCMDIMMIDVTGIDGAAPGDTVTVIGRDGGAELRCEDVAERLRTITNEVLTRLGPRLPRVYKE